MGEQTGQIRFHIMVPIYNVERYLDKCIQSVLSQDYQHFLLYLVDDGSPDGCGAICDAWAEKDSRVRVFHKPNGGLMQTRSFALERAQESGITPLDYAVFLDGDDWLHPGALRTLAERIGEYDCDCVIYGADRAIGEEAVSKLGNLSEQTVILSEKREVLLSVLTDGSFHPLWRKCVRLSCMTGWDFSPFYHISMGEDQLRSLQMYQNCRAFCFTPETLYCWRINPKSMTEQAGKKPYRVDYAVQQAILRFLRDGNYFTETDFYKYRSYCIHALTGELVRIAGLPIDRQGKVALYDTIRKTDYWRDFLDGGRYDRGELGKMALLYEAFRRRAYDVIFLAEKLYRSK